jgi:hypothetical protein
MKFGFPSIGIRFKKAKYYNPFLGCSSGYRKQTGYTRKNGVRIPTRCVHESAERKKTRRSSGQEQRAHAPTTGGGIMMAPGVPALPSSVGGGLMMVEQPAHAPTTGGGIMMAPGVPALPSSVGGGLMSTVRKMTRRCPEGYVYRKAYTRRFHTKTRVKGFSVQRKDGTRYKIYPKQKTATVKASCIREKSTERRGHKRSSRSPGLSMNSSECQKLRRGELFKYNYQYRLPVTARRLALKKAIIDQGPIRVFKKLSLASKCAKGVKPSAANVFAEDASYVEDNYAIGTFVRKH